MPPAALIPISPPTTLCIRATSAGSAPEGPKPVEVLTKSAPASFATTQPFTLALSSSRAISRITLTCAPAWWARSAIERISLCTKSSRPSLSAPMFTTMSSSVAPSFKACSDGVTFAPCGKPITVHTATPDPRSSRSAMATLLGWTQAAATSCRRASSHNRATSRSEASGFRRVWSISPAIPPGGGDQSGQGSCSTPGIEDGAAEGAVGCSACRAISRASSWISWRVTLGVIPWRRLSDAGTLHSRKPWG